MYLLFLLQSLQFGADEDAAVVLPRPSILAMREEGPGVAVDHRLKTTTIAFAMNRKRDGEEKPNPRKKVSTAPSAVAAKGKSLMIEI